MLEKLSPKQGHLFSSISASKLLFAANTDNRSETDCKPNNLTSAAESTKDHSADIVTTAFPFLLQSKVAADC